MKLRIKLLSGEKLEYNNVTKIFNNIDMLRIWTTTSYKSIRIPIDVIKRIKIKS